MRLRDNQNRAKTAKIWIQISMGVYGLVILYSLYLYNLESRIFSTGFSDGEYQFFLAFSSIMAILGLGAFIGSAITFIQWFRRAYFNAHTQFKGLRYSEGWAAGVWFVPIFNLFGPYQIASDFYKKTEALLRENGRLESQPSKFHIVGWWWGLWVTSSILDNIDVRLGATQEIELVFTVLSAAAGIACGIFVLRFITNYNEMEVQLKEIDKEGVSLSDNPDLLD